MDRNEKNIGNKYDLGSRGAGKQIEKYQKRSFRFMVLSTILLVLLVGESVFCGKLLLDRRNEEKRLTENLTEKIAEKNIQEVDTKNNDKQPIEQSESTTELQKNDESEDLNEDTSSLQDILEEKIGKKRIKAAYIKVGDEASEEDLPDWVNESVTKSDIVRKEFVLGKMYSMLSYGGPFSTDENLNQVMADKVLRRYKEGDYSEEENYSELDEDMAIEEVLIHIGGYQGNVSKSDTISGDEYREFLDKGKGEVNAYITDFLGPDKNLNNLTIKDGMDFMKELLQNKSDDDDVLQLDPEHYESLQGRFRKVPVNKDAVLDTITQNGDICWIAEDGKDDDSNTYVIYADVDESGNGYVAAIRYYYGDNKDSRITTVQEIIGMIRDGLSTAQNEGVSV